MNMQVTNVIAPTLPRTLAEVGINTVMMRDIFLQTMFRMNLDHATELSRRFAYRYDRSGTDRSGRSQRLVEATGTLHANSGNEMGFPADRPARRARSMR